MSPLLRRRPRFVYEPRFVRGNLVMHFDDGGFISSSFLETPAFCLLVMDRGQDNSPSLTYARHLGTFQGSLMSILLEILSIRISQFHPIRDAGVKMRNHKPPWTKPPWTLWISRFIGCPKHLKALVSNLGRNCLLPGL